MTKYILAPEFHRQLWLNFTPFKLLVPPVMLGCAFLLLLSKSSQHTGVESVGTLLGWCYLLIVFLHGNFSAAYAIPSEVNYHTWDFQRISAQTPFELAFGKLFGATAYTWYCALSVALFFACTIAPSEGYPVYTFLSLTLAGLLGQAATFLVSMYMSSSLAPRGSGRRSSSDMMFPFLMGAVVFTSAAGFAVSAVDMKSFRPHYGYYRNQYSGGGFEEVFRAKDLLWHGISCTQGQLALFSLLFLLGWVWLGCYRTIRAELMYKTRPVAWFAFVPAFLFWYGGWFDKPVEGLAASAALLAKAAFLTMLLESADIRKYRRLADGFRTRNIGRIFENMHKWIVTLPWLALVYLIAVGGTLGTTHAPEGYYLLALLLFLTRDGFAIHAIQQKKKYRSVFYIFAYFAAVYILCPMLILALCGEGKRLVGSVAEGIFSLFSSMGYYYYGRVETMSSYLFYPGGMAERNSSLVPAALQAALAGFIFLRVAAQQAGNSKESKT